MWIHGGSFSRGSAADYDPDYLLDQDIVLVTIQYRLGVLGFLSTETSAAPGNYGMLDQVAALQWVRQNIAAFSGDPDMVTIMGQQAGGASVHYHLLPMVLVMEMISYISSHSMQDKLNHFHQLTQHYLQN